MKLSITRKFFALAGTLTLLFALSVTPMTAQAHNGEVHLPEDATEVEKMQKLVEILEQLVALLQQRVEISGGDVHADDHAEMDALSISAEVHGTTTHIHVHHPGEDEVTYFLDAFDITDEAGIIAEVAAREELTEAEVTNAITFPSNEAEHDHENMVEATGELEGIHIMGDGSVMLGTGETLSNATINADGMIVLSDGRVVEPVMDMRDDGSMDDMDSDDHEE